MIRVEYTNGKGIATNGYLTNATAYSNTAAETFNTTSNPSYLTMDGMGIDLSGTKSFLKYSGTVLDPTYLMYRGIVSSYTASSSNLALGNNFVAIFYGDWSAIKTSISGDGEGLTITFDKNKVTHCLIELAQTQSGSRLSHYEYNGVATDRIYVAPSDFTNNTNNMPFLRISQITLDSNACSGGVRARAYISNVAMGDVHAGNFNDVQSHNILEEINVLSTDLPMHQFEAVVAHDTKPITDGKISVYSNEKYINTYWIDSVQQIAKKTPVTTEIGGIVYTNYLGEDLYSIVAHNVIGLLDRADFRGWRSTMYIKAQGNSSNYEDLSGPTVGVRVNDFISALESSTGAKIIFANPSTYGVRGYIDHKTYRHNLCAIAFALGKMVKSTDGLNIELVDIPTTVTKEYIESNQEASPPIEGNILGNAQIVDKPAVTDVEYYTYLNSEAEEIELGSSTNPEDEKGFIIRLKKTGANNWKRIEYPLGAMLIYFESGNTNGNADCYADYMRYWTKRNGDAMARVPINLTPAITRQSIRKSQEENVEKYDYFPCTGLSNISTETAYYTNQYNYIIYLSQYQSAFKGTTINRINDIVKNAKSKGVINARVILTDERVGDLVRITTFMGDVYTGIITKMNIHCGYPNDVADIEVQEWAVND